MSHLRPYCVRHAIFEAFIRPAIGPPQCRSLQLLPRRTFIPTLQCQQKLSRKQREQSGVLTAEDQERIRKAKEKAERRAAPTTPQRGSRAQALLKSLNKEAKTEAKDEKRPPENDEIKHPEISLVDRQGRFHRRINTREVLWRLNRAEEKLVVVKPAENGSMPLCKIFSIEELLKKEREMKCKAAEREKGEKMAKELELTWTIGLADMDLKFRQMAKFLGEGRKLDVTITRKYRRQVPDRDQDELRAIVDKVRAAALAVKGAKEYRPPDGRLAETMLLYFEGPKGGIQGRAENAGAVGLPGPERAGAAVAVS